MEIEAGKYKPKKGSKDAAPTMTIKRLTPCMIEGDISGVADSRRIMKKSLQRFKEVKSAEDRCAKLTNTRPCAKLSRSICGQAARGRGAAGG
jgi:hypothetical protein